MSERKQCMKCGANMADYDLRYFAVEIHVSSQTRGNQRITTTTEQMRGVDKYYVCDRCFQERRKKYSRNGAIIAFLATMILGGGIGCLAFRNSVPVVLIVAAIASVLLAIYTWVTDMKKSPEEIGAVMIKESKQGKAYASYHYISAHRERYCDPKKGGAFTQAAFRTVTQLKTNIGALLYAVISGGRGDEIVDQILAAQAGAGGGNTEVSAQVDNEKLEHFVNLKKEPRA